jgi:rubrerythrin
VILAMGAGRRAAKSIATYLKLKKQKWPVTKEDVAAFVAPTPSDVKGEHAGATVVEGAMQVPVHKAPVGVEPHSCPKCRRPVEGDEDYICCADAELQWRCDSCSKVNEGFAFPYGLCPACGTGKLSPVEQRDVEGAKALEAIRTAFEIELGGQAFYTQAAKETNEPVLQELFAKFAQMEGEHMATLSRRYHAQIPVPSSEFKTERAAVYAGIPNRPEDPANLFRLAIAFEQRAVEFFTKRGAECPEGSVERELYSELAAEEREHVDLLTTELERFKQGKPGLL